MSSSLSNTTTLLFILSKQTMKLVSTLLQMIDLFIYIFLYIMTIDSSFLQSYTIIVSKWFHLNVIFLQFHQFFASDG